MSNTRHAKRPAYWAPGPGWGTRPPSAEARHLMQAQAALPAGAWHISDWAAGALAAGPTTVLEVEHPHAGERFRLLLVRGRPIGVEPLDEAAYKLMDMHDPSHWARSQPWQRVPAQTPEGGAE